MRRLRTIRVQLLLSHLVLVLLMGFVMASAITSFYSLGRSIDRVLAGTFSAVLATEEMKESLQYQQRSFSSALANQYDVARASYRSGWRQFSIAYDHLQTTSPREAEQKVLDLREQSVAYDLAAKSFLDQASSVSEPEANRLYLENVAQRHKALYGKIQEIQGIAQQAIQKANVQAKEESERAAINSLIQTAIALILAVLLAFRLIRIALTPLEQFSEQAVAIGSGNLDRRISVRKNDEIGALANAFNTMADNLAQMRAKEERRLRRAELMSDAALDSLYDPVVVTDAQGRIVYLNQAAQGLFGPTPAAPRMPVIEHIGDRRIVRAIQSVIEQDKVSANEDPTSLIPLVLNGAQRTYRLRSTPMKDPNGQLLGSVTVLEDVTHMRELDRLKTDFIGVASHELRTPVTSMLLSTQLLEEGAAGPLTPDQKEIVQVQRQDLERLDKLMRDLLDMSRLESGSAPPRFEFIVPDELLDSAFRSTRAAAAQKGLDMNVKIDADLPKVRADRNQVGRVIVNLINNAIRHTNTGGKIMLRASGDADQVTFSVEDTGSGIPRNYLQQIFDRFVQVPGATGGGAGLGLSISNQIVQAHGGRMQVESELGKGSIFSFTLQTDQCSEL